MKNQNFLLPILTRACALAALAAMSSLTGMAAPVTVGAPFTTANITDIAGDVTITPFANPTAKLTPKLSDPFNAPDTLSTGRKSRVQLTAADGTIARVGSNTAFSLEPTSRTIHLQQGSILFNSPKGIGGGTIQTNSATATVLGTTIIVSATPDGGFKILVLEGTATIKLPNGQTVTLTAGQMTFVLPASKGGGTGPILNFDLKKEAASSNLVNGFTIDLPSKNLIIDATNLQQQKISTGEFTQTKQVVIGAVSPDQVVLVDSTTFDNVNNINNPPTGLPNLVLGPTLSVLPPSANTFTSPGDTFSAGQLGLPSGVIPNNSYTVTGLIGGQVSASSYVNLAPLDGLNKVDIVAQDTFAFTPSPPESDSTTFVPSIITADADTYNFTDFEGLSSTLRLNLEAKNGFTFAPNLDIDAYFNPTPFPEAPEISTTGFRTDIVTGPPSAFVLVGYSPFVTTFELDSVLADLQMANVSIDNYTGSINLKSILGDVNLTDTDVYAGGTESLIRTALPVAIDTLSDPFAGNITVQSTLGNVSLLGGEFTAREGATNINALNNVNINQGTTEGNMFYSALLQVTAGGNLTVVGSHADNEQLNLMAAGVLSITGSAEANSEAKFILAGDTVDLNEESFSGCSTVSVYTKYGALNSGTIPIAGYVNLVETTLPYHVTLGVTADNPAVQAATNTPLALGGSDPFVTTPVNFFANVLFRPTDLNETFGDNTYEIVNGLIGDAVTATGNVDFTDVSQHSSELDVAAHTISISGCTTFNPAEGISTLVLESDVGLTIAPGTHLGADFASSDGTFVLQSIPGIDFEHMTFANSMANFEANSAEGNLTFNNSTVSLTCSDLEIQLTTTGDSAAIIINNSSLTANKSESSIFANADNISVTSSNVSGMEQVELYAGKVGLAVESSNVSATCGDIYINSYANVSIANSTLSSNTSSSNSNPQLSIYAAHVVSVVNSTLSTSYANVNAGDTLTMDTVNMNSASGINMSARTINLSNINFASGSQVSLNSANGLLAPNPNTSAASVVGDVNFITKVTYNHVPAQNDVSISQGGLSHASSPPIQIGVLPLSK